MSEGTQDIQQTQRHGYLQRALDFYGQSMGRLKGQMQSDRDQLESLLAQLPAGSQLQVQEMIDSYKQFEDSIDQAAQEAGVQDAVDQAAQTESYNYFAVARIPDKHIEVTPGVVGGKPRIAGRRISVQNIAIWHERMGRSADEISTEYDLTLADVYAALAYYFDHRAQIDESIREGEAFAEALRERTPSKVSRKFAAREPRA